VSLLGGQYCLKQITASQHKVRISETNGVVGIYKPLLLGIENVVDSLLLSLTSNVKTEPFTDLPTGNVKVTLY
jgi:hypothetical protein